MTDELGLYRVEQELQQNEALANSLSRRVAMLETGIAERLNALQSKVTVDGDTYTLVGLGVSFTVDDTTPGAIKLTFPVENALILDGQDVIIQVF